MTTARTLYRVTVLLYAALAATASIAADGRSWSCGRSSRWRVDVLEDDGWREVETELVLTPDGRRNLHLVPDDVLAEYDGPSFWSRRGDCFTSPAVADGPVVDTVGAGDAFSAAFLAGVLGGRSLEEAARAGNVRAGKVAARAGAVPDGV